FGVARSGGLPAGLEASPAPAVKHAGEAPAAENGRRLARPHAGCATGDDRLIFFPTMDILRQVVKRNILGAGDMPFGIFSFRAYVQDSYPFVLEGREIGDAAQSEKSFDPADHDAFLS